MALKWVRLALFGFVFLNIWGGGNGVTLYKGTAYTKKPNVKIGFVLHKKVEFVENIRQMSNNVDG